MKLNCTVTVVKPLRMENVFVSHTGNSISATWISFGSGGGMYSSNCGAGCSLEALFATKACKKCIKFHAHKRTLCRYWRFSPLLPHRLQSVLWFLTTALSRVDQALSVALERMSCRCRLVLLYHILHGYLSCLRNMSHQRIVSFALQWAHNNCQFLLSKMWQCIMCGHEVPTCMATPYLWLSFCLFCIFNTNLVLVNLMGSKKVTGCPIVI